MSKLKFTIASEVLNIGLQGSYWLIEGMRNYASHPEFEAFKEGTIHTILADLSADKLKNDPILGGFRKLHDAVGRSNKRFVASPENLLTLLLQTRRLPHVNLLVDIYNLISIKSRLALGAHDTAKISGNITLRMTTGTEGFTPLGATEPQTVGAGEYSYIDEANEVICRLEVRQVEKTKVTLDSTACFYIVQGNANTDQFYIESVAAELIELTTRFCGGIAHKLYPGEE
jgi:DNA/RNA-binding domain of Phe-tRNA-synthetase-like protein